MFKLYCPEVEEPSLPYYLPKTGERIDEFIPFPRVLAPYEMQTPSLGFELWLLNWLPMIITITPQVFPHESYILFKKINVY